MTGGSGPDQVLSGSAYKVLALQVELCSPRLIASHAEARRRPLRAFGRGSGRRASPTTLLLSSASRAPLSVPPNLLARRRAKGRRVVPMAGLMAKIRKWLGLGKKS
jgi:hypothetical protein